VERTQDTRKCSDPKFSTATGVAAPKHAHVAEGLVSDNPTLSSNGDSHYVNSVPPYMVIGDAVVHRSGWWESAEPSAPANRGAPQPATPIKNNLSTSAGSLGGSGGIAPVGFISRNLHTLRTSASKTAMRLILWRDGVAVERKRFVNAP
jgi:hypothetical protein